MKKLSLPPKLEREINLFILNLKKIYKEDLLSITLYGSAASSEFAPAYSNLNILVILKSTALSELKKATREVNKFRNLNALFLTEEYISSSLDIFPIEFLDMQENYIVLYGKDSLKDLCIDLKNLRFQCEQELKVKVLGLKQLYLGLNDHPAALREPLIRTFTSVLHILRNVLRLKNKLPPYKKEDLLKELAVHFKIGLSHWEKILASKLKKIRIGNKETEELFLVFVNDLEEIIRTVDAL
ncbi:MAG: hypothetical protein PHC71_03410 [Candidatus Omnitrophica bacterium]|nr:hypothetical protein [Candidatus Omnitrophota bacterium]